jgi:copper chaperone
LIVILVPDLTGHLEAFPMSTIELNVQGMTCGSCVKHVSAALNQLAGVTTVEVDLAAALVRVTGSAHAEALIAALDNAGYPAQTATAVAASSATPAKNASKGGCCCR